jgi:putative endopeptidase
MSSRRTSARGAVIALALLAAPSLGLAAEPPRVDATVRPGDDFYRYANGPWLAETPRPPGAANYDTGTQLRDRAARQVRDLIESLARAPAARGDARRIGDFYAARMDSRAIEAKGLAPLSADLTAIAAIGDRRALAAYLGRTLRLDDGTNSQTEGLLGVWVHQGFHDPRHYVPHIVQGGLGLPDRDDYLSPDRAPRRAAYQAHVAAMLALAGLDAAPARAARVLALESAIAATHASAEDNADVFTTDHAWRRADFDAKAPGLEWAAYFTAAGLARQTDFNVWQPAAVSGAATLAASAPLETWRDDLAFHLVEHDAAVLPKAFGDEDAAYVARLANMAPATPDRAQQAVAATNGALGDAVGRLYVARYFPPRAKAAATAMVDNIRLAFRDRIAASPWMSAQTRATALGKLAKVQVGLGYPDRWIDYSGLAVSRGDAFGNQRRAEAFAYRHELAKLAKPVDPAEWFEMQLLPQAAGALINFTPNSLQFSAGLLQPPFFDPAGDPAANYGSAGAGLAHEVSHSFDELGNIYDADGSLVRWWTPDDLARYRAAAAPLAAQFAAYCPRPGLCVKPGQVLGESISDLAGLLVAYDAYRLSLHGRADAVKGGLTGDQRFFIAFAQRWRRLQSEAALRRQVETDTHLPGEYRADTVRNLEAWRRAFHVGPGDKLWLNPADRVHIW